MDEMASRVSRNRCQRLEEKCYKMIVWLAMLYNTVLGNHERAYTKDVNHRDANVKMDVR